MWNRNHYEANNITKWKYSTEYRKYDLHSMIITPKECSQTINKYLLHYLIYMKKNIPESLLFKHKKQ